MQGESEQHPKIKQSVTPQGYRQGKWLPEEHKTFLTYIKEYGTNWDKIAQMVGTRNASQVRSHAQKYNNKLENDDKKIGSKPLTAEQMKEIMKTRSKSPKSGTLEQTGPANEQTAELPPEMGEGESEELGSSFQPQPQQENPQAQIQEQRWEGQETAFSDTSDESFFMKRIFPKIGDCPLEQFSLFTLIQMQPNNERINENQAGQRSPRWKKL